jgi:hypothetical protein
MAIVYHEKMIDNPAMHLINWLFFYNQLPQISVNP